jgi:hypothetical protein
MAMTALERYVRLEALGLWREGSGAPPREVVVSFGTTTLVLRDLRDAPLGHWALAGVRAIGREGGATIYAMSEDGGETLAIRDREMVAAIAAVSRADRVPAPAAPPRRRVPLGSLLLLVVLAAAAYWGPGLVRAQAARMLPPERAAEYGDRLLIALISVRGEPCAEPAGQRALDRIAAEAAPAAPPEVRVLDLGGAPVVALPGGTLLIDRGTVTAGDPGEIAAAIRQGLVRDPEAELMRAVGPLAALRYLLTGELGEPAFARAAAALLSAGGPASEPRGNVPAQPGRGALQGICG